jgi:hypothetical protein
VLSVAAINHAAQQRFCFSLDSYSTAGKPKAILWSRCRINLLHLAHRHKVKK